MDDGSYTEEQFEILEAVIEGIHNARAAHPIISKIATKADSVLLANAALDALQGAGFRIVKKD
jgi:hypothetical protein